MFLNYLKTSIRNLLRFKLFSLINISGLAISLACCFLIILWIDNELSYDRFHENFSDIYRIERHNMPRGAAHSSQTSGLLAHKFKGEYPEIKDAARLSMLGPLRFQSRKTFRYGDKLFYESVSFADASFLRMFTFPAIYGNAHIALGEPYSVVLTEKVARRHFGSQNPVGKTLSIDNQADFTITAVLKNIPSNSHLSFDVLLPFALIDAGPPWDLYHMRDDWYGSLLCTYIQLHEGHSGPKLAAKIRGFYRSRSLPANTNIASEFDLGLKPLKSIHLTDL